MASTPHTTAYLTCPRYKGQPRKHVSVCEICRYRKKCDAYFRYRQPELPFDFPRKTSADSLGQGR